MRAGILALTLTFLATGCGGGTATTTSLVETNFPTAAVRVWLDAVASGDPAEIARVVEPNSEAVLVALENGFDADQLATVATRGLPDDLARRYWSSFRGSFEEFRSGDLSSLEVLDFEEIPDTDFAVVEVRGPEGVASVITRRAATGTWQVDLIATFAPALGTRLRDVTQMTGSDAAVDKVAEIVTSYVVPAVEVAAKQAGNDRTLNRVLDELKDTVHSS